MDYKDALFCLILILLYGFTFLTYAAIGNTIQGNKPKGVGDFFHPFAKLSLGQNKVGGKQDYFFAIYYSAFLVFVIATLSKVMSLRSTFRSWLDRLIGVQEEETPTAVTVTPTTSSGNASTSKALASSSSTSIPKSKSKIKAKSRPSSQRPRPSVMRSSVVDPDKQIIPPLPRLSIREDTSEKLSRVLLKFDSMDLSDSPSKDRMSPLVKRKND